MNIIQDKLNFFSLFKRNFLYKIKKKINIDLEKINKKSLDELFSHYDTDKANFISSKKEKGHGFSKFYEIHLNSFKEKKIKILEIGSYSGAAAAAFVKYFPMLFPLYTISYAVEISRNFENLVRNFR